MSQIPNWNIFIFIKGIVDRIFPKFICNGNWILYRIGTTNKNISIDILSYEGKKLWKRDEL